MTAVINKLEQVYAWLYHYVDTERRARSIAANGLMYPSSPDLENFVEDESLSRPRVNFTDVIPEEGREVISGNTSLAVNSINYGLELLVPAKRLVQRIEFEPRCYQIYTEDPVRVIVLRWWNIDKVERWTKKFGYKINRYLNNHLIPQAVWEKAVCDK